MWPPRTIISHLMTETIGLHKRKQPQVLTGLAHVGLRTCSQQLLGRCNDLWKFMYDGPELLLQVTYAGSVLAWASCGQLDD